MNKKIDLRSKRIELGLKQRDVASLVGISETVLRKWERGLEMPDSKSLSAIASVYGVSEKDLRKGQSAHSSSVIPGEGYTTSEAGKGEIKDRQLSIPKGKLKVLDIFCGAGGLSYGFESTGKFVTTAGIDLLPDRIETFRANHKYAKTICGDLTSYSLKELKSEVGEIDVVVGGPPCQGFSSIRPFRNLTEGDPRNSLAEHYVLVIGALRPKWFVFENVVGILTHENGERLKAVLEGLKDAGYNVDWRIMNSALFGVPQFRERIVIVGNRTGASFKWPEPTHFAEYKSMAGKRAELIRAEPLFAGHLPPAVTLMEAIGDLPPVESGCEATEYTIKAKTDYQRLMRESATELTMHKSTKHSDKMLEIIRHAGANINALPPGMVKSGFSSCYSRLDAKKPSTTLTVNFVHPASNRCIHPVQNRALTPREGARIQSFPDHFVFYGSQAQIVKQIGNAVPPFLGRAIAEAIACSQASKSLEERARTSRRENEVTA